MRRYIRAQTLPWQHGSNVNHAADDAHVSDDGVVCHTIGLGMHHKAAAATSHMP